MYGLKVVRHGACHKHTHPTVFYRIGLMDKNVHYSKMSKTRKNRESLSRSVGNPLKKEQIPFRPLVGEMVLGGPSVFRTDHGAAFYHPTSVYCVFPQTHTTVRISDSCPVSLPRASIQKYAACMTFLRRADKNRSERRVEAHGGICRTWPDAEHIPLHLIFTRFPA